VPQRIYKAEEGGEKLQERGTSEYTKKRKKRTKKVVVVK
jgi:hypothetical protein